MTHCMLPIAVCGHMLSPDEEGIFSLLISQNDRQMRGFSLE